LKILRYDAHHTLLQMFLKQNGLDHIRAVMQLFLPAWKPE
jgi:hypothetical protein